jgi:dTMP kinase
MFIILNGVDGSGKDTQFEKLLPLFESPVLLREPGGTPTAEVIRDVLLSKEYTILERLSLIQPFIYNNQATGDTKEYLQHAFSELKRNGLTAKAEVYLYAASRAQTNQTLVIPAMKEGKTVLGRRSIACSMSYQGFARQEEGIDMDFVWEANRDAIKGALPTLEIFLDLSPEVAAARLRGRTEKQDRLDAEGDDFHARTREGYMRFYRDYCPYPHVILDANGSVDDVHSKILATIEAFKEKTT